MITPETKARIEREAEERYGLKEPNYTAKDMRSKTRQEAYVAGATAYAEKLEAIMAAVEARISNYDERTGTNRLFYTQKQIEYTYVQKVEARDILSIIDKHLAK